MPMMAVADLPAIALAQMEVIPGRPDLNVERMEALIDQARAAGAEVVAFPEMCVSGYILGDLWEVDALVEEWATLSDRVRAASAGLTLLFGNVVCDGSAIGQDGRLRKINAVRVCHDGEWVDRPGLPSGLPAGCQPKTLQPNYRFFDDDRHFISARTLAQEQGRSVYDWVIPFEVPRRDGGTFRFGAQLCEDIWCQDYRWEGEILDTLGRYAQAGAHAVFNLSSSPWTWQKNDKRNRTVRDILKRSPVPFLYVNHVGGQNNGKNILVFDGDSTAYEGDGAIVAQAQSWREGLVIVGGAPPPPPAEPRAAPSEVESVYQAILQGLHHLEHILGAPGRYLIGVSGGIDSSVVACLLERAFGAERVFAVNMPTHFNATVTRDNARDLAAALDINFLGIPIEGLYGAVSDIVRDAVFPRSEGEYTRLVDENIQARIRSSDVLSGIAARHGLLFTNNGNKTELALGYTTLYGDLSGAVAPIADLYKVQVFELAQYLNEVIFEREVIPANLLDRSTVPSAELSVEQDVTQGKGDPILYGYHCAVLRQLIEYRRHPVELVDWLLDGCLLERLGWHWEDARFREAFPDPSAWLDDLEWVDRQLRTSYFKRIQSPPLIVLSKRAFGFDLRESQVPACSTQRWKAAAARVRDLTSWPSTE
jgi:NAD+ synthase (glutamine-hydrolysing)